MRQWQQIQKTAKNNGYKKIREYENDTGKGAMCHLAYDNGENL